MYDLPLKGTKGLSLCMIYLETVQEYFHYVWFTLRRYKSTFYMYDLPWKGTKELPVRTIYL